MAAYKLTYYNSKGLAEPIRFLLEYGGIEYEDIRVPFEFTGKPTELPKEIKDKCPWGQVPILEFDGKCLAQSMTITRFLARKVNLAGKDDYEAAKCDEYVDTVKDMSKDFHPIYFEKDTAKKAEMIKTLKENLAAKYFKKFEAIASANGGSHLVGNSLTWADIYLAYAVGAVTKAFETDFFEGFPSLQKLSDSVFSEPKIKAWTARRPVTQF